MAEGQDVFAGPVEVTDGEDPFAGAEDWSSFGEPGESQPLRHDGATEQEAAPPTGELPVVGREGQPAEGHDELVRAEDAYQYKLAHGEPISEELAQRHARFEAQRAAYQRPQPADPPPPPGAASAAGAPQQAPARPPEAQPTPDTAPEPASAAPEPSAAQAQAPPGPLEAPQASSEAQAGESDGEEGELAPEPEEPKDERGRTTHRRYYIMAVDGPGKFTQVSWYEKDAKMVPTGTRGAKRQSVALARSSGDALKVGYLALGSPPDGATIVAVAALHFQPKRVRPMPPEPSKARLEIS